MDNDKVDDELLGAWLDGELATPDRSADRQRVEAWLQAHPDDAARVRAWAGDAAALRAQLGPLADEPVPPALRRVVWRRAAPSRWLLAASAAGLLLLGGFIGAQLARRTDPEVAALGPGRGGAAGWVERAAYAHGVYTVEPLHAVEVGAREGHLARWLTARIHAPVKLFDLRAQGFELVGGRLLPDGAGKSAQLMYQDAAGLRVTVYLRQPDEGTDAAFRYERQGDLGLFYWVESGLGYALVGALPKDRLLALAEAIYRQRTPPDAAATPAAPAASPPGGVAPAS